MFFQWTNWKSIQCLRTFFLFAVTVTISPLVNSCYYSICVHILEVSNESEGCVQENLRLYTLWSQRNRFSLFFARPSSHEKASQIDLEWSYLGMAFFTNAYAFPMFTFLLIEHTFAFRVMDVHCYFSFVLIVTIRKSLLCLTFMVNVVCGLSCNLEILNCS